MMMMISFIQDEPNNSVSFSKKQGVADKEQGVRIIDIIISNSAVKNRPLQN